MRNTKQKQSAYDQGMIAYQTPNIVVSGSNMPHLQDFSSLLTEAFHIGLRQGRALHQRLDLPLQLFVMRLNRRLPHILAHLKLCSSKIGCQTPEQPPKWPKMADIGVPKMALRWACTGWLRIPLPCFQKDFSAGERRQGCLRMVIFLPLVCGGESWCEWEIEMVT